MVDENSSADGGNRTRLVVVGSSAGGIEALSVLVSTLTEDFTAPVVIAQHLSPSRESHLQEILSRRCALPIRTVTGHEPLQGGVVYVVPADRHLNISDSEIEVSAQGERQPSPSVNLLLSSAAQAIGEGLIAIILRVLSLVPLSGVLGEAPKPRGLFSGGLKGKLSERAARYPPVKKAA